MEFLKTIGGKVASGVVALAVIGGAISWYEMDPATKHAIVSGTGRILAWLGVVLAVPWAAFFVIGQVSRLENNAAGAALVLALTGLEAALLAWLFSWSIHGATAVVFFCAALLLAGVYNLFTCDWIAEKVQ